MVRKQLQIASIVIMFVFLFTGCGYRFAGSGQLPNGVQRIHIPVFKNRTRDTGASTMFTNQLIQEFQLRRPGVVASTPEDADAVLQGTIEHLKLASLSHVEDHSSVERNVTAVVSLVLTGQDGKTMWSVKKMTGREAYFVDADKRSTEINRKEALESIEKKMSEMILNRMTEDF